VPDYSPPLDKLLTMGEPQGGDEWPDYLKLGLGPEHVPDLIRMATDPELNRGDPESREVWAPLHAWRTLGQLRAEAAVGPLLTLLQDSEEEGDDWLFEEVRRVFGLIGSPALATLEAFVADRSHGTYSRWAALDGIKEVAEEYPETRSECVAALTRQLEQGVGDDPVVNGVVVGALLDLHAVESAPVMEQAFAADAVDESISGGWEDVQYNLGLTDKPPARRRYLDPWLPGSLPSRPGRTAKQKAKTRRKQAKRARKRNRKRR